MRIRSHVWMGSVAIVLVPVLYLASLMPICWAFNRKYLFTSGSPSEKFVAVYVVPFQVVANQGPPKVRRVLTEYVFFLDRL